MKQMKWNRENKQNQAFEWTYDHVEDDEVEDLQSQKLLGEAWVQMKLQK